MLSRIPSVTLAELQKEDAVMIVATQGTAGSEVTAITLLGGVEPILTASPNGSSAAADNQPTPGPAIPRSRKYLPTVSLLH